MYVYMIWPFTTVGAGWSVSARLLSLHLTLELEVQWSGHREGKMEVQWEVQRQGGTTSASWARQGGRSDTGACSCCLCPCWCGVDVKLWSWAQTHTGPRLSPSGSSRQMSPQIIGAAHWPLLHFHPLRPGCHYPRGYLFWGEDTEGYREVIHLLQITQLQRAELGSRAGLVDLLTNLLNTAKLQLPQKAGKEGIPTAQRLTCGLW